METMDDPILKAMLDRIEQEAPEMQEAWAALDIDWHCRRHGVVHDVPEDKAGYVQRVIEWHAGHGACRWTNVKHGVQSVEFVPMTKVYPPPQKPWEWCGTTVLFPEWQEREAAVKAAAATFAPGDRVSFKWKGERRFGMVRHANSKSVSVQVEGLGKFRCPPDRLVREG